MPKKKVVDEELEKQIKTVIDNLLFKNKNHILVVTAFETTNEIQMKNYLLNPM